MYKCSVTISLKPINFFFESWGKSETMIDIIIRTFGRKVKPFSLRLQLHRRASPEKWKMVKKKKNKRVQLRYNIIILQSQQRHERNKSHASFAGHVALWSLYLRSNYDLPVKFVSVILISFKRPVDDNIVQLNQNTGIDVLRRRDVKITSDTWAH